MKKLLLSSCAILSLSLTAGIAQADSNAVAPAGNEQETISLAGTFNHGGTAGDPLNSVATIAPGTFAGNFNVNQVNITADASSVNAATWLSEVQFGINDAGGNGFAVVNADGTQTYTGPTPITATGATSGAFTSQDTWTLEFFDSFDDDVTTVDSITENVTVEFVGATTPGSDVDGLFGLNLASGSASSVGEFAVGGLLDTYDFTLTSAGVFNAFTSADAAGFTGADADTELFLVDSAGAVLASNDDTVGLFSDTGNVDLVAGDYSLVVGTFNTIDNGDGTLTAGGGTGDYALSATFTAVPEPSSLAILGIFGIGLCSRRRR